MAGALSQGADCAETLQTHNTELTPQEFFDFLEGTGGEGPALCTSSSDWAKIKTFIDQACHKLGTSCTPEVRSGIRAAVFRVNQLQSKVRSE